MKTRTSHKQPLQGVAAIESRKAQPLSPERIRQRAHEIYLARGGLPGWELEDWLQAERELQQESGSEHSPRQTP